jgi:hypothetical protein
LASPAFAMEKLTPNTAYYQGFIDGMTQMCIETELETDFALNMCQCIANEFARAWAAGTTGNARDFAVLCRSKSYQDHSK